MGQHGGTLRPHIDAYLRERRARGEIGPKSFRDHRSHLYSFDRVFGDRPVQRLGLRDIERWFEANSQWSANTKRSRKSTLNRFCKYLLRRRLIAHDPFDGLGRIRVPRRVSRYLTPAEVLAVIRACPDERARLIIWIMAYVGLRCVEVARLDVTDYDPEARILFVKGKADHEREVTVPTRLADHLDRWLDQHGTMQGPLIHNYRDVGQGLEAGTISIMVVRWMYEAGVKKHPRDGRAAHSLRHTCASDVLEECGDLRVVQELLGHANLSSTEPYLKKAGLKKMAAAVENRCYDLAA